MISVVLATYNEALNIEACLAAVKSWADEIIVVDGSSTDDTTSLAKANGAKVISTTNKPNFHINKQMAMDAATGDLVLQLDADEIVDSQLSEAIKKLHKQILEPSYLENPDNPVAWWIKRKNYFLNTWLSKGGQYPDPVIRLYLKGKARLPQKDVHEQMSVDGPLGLIDGHLLHYSNPSLSDYLRKFDTYTSFKAKQLFNAKTDLNWSNNWRYLIWLPLTTFLSLFLRHRGYVDGLAGFIFAWWSGQHHVVAYLKLWELKQHA